MRTADVIAACLAVAASLCGQGDPAAPQVETRHPAPHLTYPGDRDRPVCQVDGKTYSLGDVVAHITEFHSEEFDQFLATPAGNLYFDTRYPALWVRYFADVVALRAEAQHRRIGVEAMDRAAGQALKAAFQRLVKSYGRDQWTQGELDTLLQKFQRDNGLAVEAAGLLDLLVPDDATEQQLHDHYRGYVRELQGFVTFAHILVYHRHPVTMQLLDKPARDAARAKMADIKARLKADGSNFEDVAARYSEDRRSAERGGVFENVARFDPRLPPVLARTAWALGDGEWTGPIESQYGLHLVKRIKYGLRGTLIYTPQQHPVVQRHRRKMLQENLLYELRDKHRVTLLY